MFENTMAAITNDSDTKARPSDLPGRAMALREALRDKEDTALDARRARLLAEWLKRLADSRP